MTSDSSAFLTMKRMLSFSCANQNRLFQTPHEYLPAFEEALKAYILLQPPLPEVRQPTKDDEFYVGVEGSFGANNVSPRGLTSPMLRSLVAVEGIVTKGLYKMVTAFNQSQCYQFGRMITLFIHSFLQFQVSSLRS